MSRLPTAPKQAKGALVSPVKVEVFAAVQKHLNGTLQRLRKALPHLDPMVVRDTLYYLQAQGHVHNVYLASAGTRHWRMGPRPPSARPANVVPPRQVDLMRGPVYQPGPPVVTRPGAMDYARYPSNFCGERRPFKGGM